MFARDRLFARRLALGVAASLLVGAVPAEASVSYFSDRSIEQVAARLKLPPGGPDVTVPDSREARVVELEAFEAERTQAQAELRQREPAMFARMPALEAEVAALDAVELSRPEREALLEHGAAGLDPAKRQAFEAAGPRLGALRDQMREYFDSYDRFMRSEIRARIHGLVLEAQDKRAQLEGHLSRRRARKLDERLAKLVAHETRFRRFQAHPRAKNHHKALSAIVCMRAGAKVVDQLDVRLGKAGLGPKRTWGERLKGLGRQVKEAVRAAKIGAACVPAMTRVLAYLYNPFRKQRDPEKVSKLLRFVSKSYQWASGMKLKIEGAENVPSDRPVIFAFSHRSELEDAILMMGSTPDQYSFMMGQWAFPAFLNDKLVREPSVINVGGKKPDGSTVNAVEEAIASLEDGRNVVIFPEGMTPTDVGETQPLRSGIDLVARAVGAEPVAIVAVTLDDPANGLGGPRHRSIGGPIELTVTFSKPLDPIKLRAVPGADRGLVLEAIRALWHRRLYDEKPSAGETLTVPPAPAAQAFQTLHGE